MLEKTKKFVEEVNELRSFIAKETGESMLSQYTSVDDVILCKRLLDLCDSTTDLLIEEAKIMDEMNSKLDKLLIRTGA